MCSRVFTWGSNAVPSGLPSSNVSFWVWGRAHGCWHGACERSVACLHWTVDLPEMRNKSAQFVGVLVAVTGTGYTVQGAHYRE